jgi:hypothetical protein
VVYDDSWNEPPVASPERSSVASLPDYIGVVDLAFAKPDLVYPGGLDLSATGLEYRYSGQLLHGAIALLKARHPNTQVLLSIGGAVYNNWDHLDEHALMRLVKDLGADGVDLDFEPPDASCAADATQHMVCTTDRLWGEFTTRIRAVLPRPYIMTASVWSVGAFGEGVYRSAGPPSRYTGIMLAFLRSPQASQIDMLCINAYDAGPEFDPIRAFQAYRAVWPNMLAVGLEVQRTGGAGPFYSAGGAEALARVVAKDRLGAMMLYPLLATPEGPESNNRPDGRALAKALCRGMGLIGCEAPLP